MTPIEKAVAQMGGQNAAGRLFGVAYQTVQQWIAQRRVPAEYCPRIEHLTGVRCEDLNDRVEWQLICDADRLLKIHETPTIDHAADAPTVGSAGAEVMLGADTAPLQAALASLEAVFKASPEVCEHFLGSLDSLVELCRVDGEGGAATGTGDIRISFQPSDRLRDFLAAAGAGDLQLHAAGI